MTAHATDHPEPLSRADHKTLALAALGGALEIYDFIIFVFFAVTLAKLFFPPDMPEWLRQLQGFGIYLTGYVARPLGGLVMAHYADRLGRKRVFSLSILMMALPCLLIGVMPVYADVGYFAPLGLLVLRILQGVAVGAEVPSAWAFVAEHVPPARRGYALGFLQAGLTFGYLLGALVATALARMLTPEQLLEFGWRLPFVLGGVFGVLGVWLRRWLNETPVFLAMRERQGTAAASPLDQVLKAHRGALLPAVLLTCVLTTAVVLLVVLTPTLMQERFGFSVADTFTLSCVGIVFLNIGCVLAGALVDRIGPWRALRIYSLLLPLGTLALYGSLILKPALVAPAYALAGLCSGVVGVVPAIMVSLFPPQVRVSGISLTYNLTYAAWASFTTLGLLAAATWSPWALVGYSVLLGVVGVGCCRVWRGDQPA
jgi:MFS family permease